MAVSDAMFLFEVMIESVTSYTECKQLVIKSDFADIFSLELKDPKQLHIIMPEPPPLPPEPPGKKGKKKPPKPKKGKKGVVEAPPPEPVIQAGQSVLFTSSAEVLIQNMKKFPVEVSLWSNEDYYVFVGSTIVAWSPLFFKYLEEICDCKEPPPVAVNEEYNIFEEGTAKLIAKLGIQIKLTYLKDKLSTAFRTLSEDPTVKKYLYTGINSKTTSYLCTMKTTDADFEENCNKVENNFIRDTVKVMQYADYKNAPGANVLVFKKGDICCLDNEDKPSDIHKGPETLPDTKYIVDYVRKIIASCNDNMRMLTPRPTIRPRIRATDIDRLCYCKETAWPEGPLAEITRKQAQSAPCPLCIDATKQRDNIRQNALDIANIRGPCGRPDCRIARDLRSYIVKLIEEDKIEINLNDIIGPCGSKDCTLSEKIQQFIRREGVFDEGVTLDGLGTQCACVEKMFEALTKKPSVQSVSSKEYDDATSNESKPKGSTSGSDVKQDKSKNKGPSPKDAQQEKPKDSSMKGSTSGNETKKVNIKDDKGSTSGSDIKQVYYCTIHYDFAKDLPSKSKSSSPAGSRANSPSQNSSCAKSGCSYNADNGPETNSAEECDVQQCKGKRVTHATGGDDSDVIINIDDIENLCNVKTCGMARNVKDLILEGYNNKQKYSGLNEDTCNCDCVCTLKIFQKTTYCPVCGGYQILGEDLKKQPMYAMPYPCPMYHKSADTTVLDHEKGKPADAVSQKSGKSYNKQANQKEVNDSVMGTKSTKKKASTKDKIKKVKVEKKKPIPKEIIEQPPPEPIKPKRKRKIKVPKHMGWLWTAEDIPGMKPRPMWKPGAAHKVLVRRYRAVRGQIDLIAKKKRAMMKKKTDLKPAILIKKTDGEYTVQMEVLRKYSRERLPFQNPFDEKPPVVYTIGKTEEEKEKIRSIRERRERRDTRRKSRFIQSTFRDKCQEICLKAYNQAIGVLPLPSPDSPDCPCKTMNADMTTPSICSCSCSDDVSMSGSDTDGDDWVIEFTPPAARWNPKAKHPPVLANNETQYTYLDYRVTIIDKNGNPVPRFFKGPDGKQECSDLGGFWAPGHVWNEIEKDGYIGVDNRWIPMNFTGPDGMFYSARDGFFADSSGQTWRLGIDGYVDKDGKWAWYPKKRSNNSKSKIPQMESKPNIRKDLKVKGQPIDKLESKGGVNKPARETTSKVGASVKPKPTALNVADKTKDKKAVSYSQNAKNKLVMSFLSSYDKFKPAKTALTGHVSQSELKRIAHYQEILKELEFYDCLNELKPPLKTSRACNTAQKYFLPFTMTKNISSRNM